MPNVSSTENNFTKGLLTEFTGLNFPENAATSASNCTFTLIGDVTRRLGIDLEPNFVNNTVVGSNVAITTYKWNNAGGDGTSQIICNQVGNTIFFYLSSAVEVNTASISSNLLSSTVVMSNFTAQGGSFDTSVECQFADGNGYLFITHPDTDPVFCTFIDDVVTPNAITIKIRDFIGAVEPGNPPVTARPAQLTSTHNYNLVNQGWSSAAAWNFTSHSTSVDIVQPGGSMEFTDAPAGLPITPGEAITVTGGIQFSGGTNTFSIAGVVQSYVGNTLIMSIAGFSQVGSFTGFLIAATWYVIPTASANYINAWNTAASNFPSNADVWWQFKDNTGVFNPLVTIANVTLSSPAPQGSLILSAFNQNFTVASGVQGLGSTITTVRPRTCTWFQGRTWYAGCDASLNNTGPGNNAFYTWTENIYFSQIIQQGDNNSFGKCYQTNDPTSETLFDLLPTDGGVITIPGCGAIYKLFPIQNGMLVFAANGVWFITGSQGIGFSANDFTVTNISYIRSISSYSFINVNGLPMFWNEEGIYMVEPTQGGALQVNPITVGTILTYYNNIPTKSKIFARGVYDPINYIVQWIYKSTVETSVTDRYSFDTMLNFNTYNKAFYPYNLDISNSSLPVINSIVYVSAPGGTASPVTSTGIDASIYYFTSLVNNRTFALEIDETFVDWAAINGGENFVSTFTTGYKLHGDAQRRFQLEFLYVYSRADTATSYKIQSLWDYATNGNSGRWSTAQLINNWNPNFGNIVRRHRLRGRGLALQLQFTSVDGMPFDIMGWSAFETTNSGV